MIILLFADWLFLLIEAIYSSAKTLATPAEKLPPKASHGAALVGLLIASVCLIALVGFIVYGLIEERGGGRS